MNLTQSKKAPCVLEMCLRHNKIISSFENPLFIFVHVKEFYSESMVYVQDPSEIIFYKSQDSRNICQTVVMGPYSCISTYVMSLISAEICVLGMNI